MSLLEIENASVYYGDFQALYDLTLTVEAGEIFACIGANGAGKSTLLKTISGVLEPRQGRILFDGLPIQHLAPHKRVDMGISLVPEGRQVFPSLTVRENLQMGAYRRRSGPWNIDAVFELFPNLRSIQKRQAACLSGGEQQALAIGRGLMSNPRLILLDEISLGLAPLIVRHIYEALPRFLEAGCTTLLVEQDVQQALSVAGHVACFLEGKIALQGVPGEFTNEQITKAYFGV